METREFPSRAAHWRLPASASSGCRLAVAATLALAATAAVVSGAARAAAAPAITVPVNGHRPPQITPAAFEGSQPLEPNDQLPQPDWWDGRCDDVGNPISYQLSANFDGLQTCGPGSDQSGYDDPVEFFPGAWGEYEWECVELVMRWMYMAWGVAPYAADGNDVVADYPNGSPDYPTLTIVNNGTRGEAPQPGDVLSLDDGDGFGHTEVVTSSAVNAAGDGTATAISENDGWASNGWTKLTVSNWVVSDGFPDDTVLAWLHNPAWSLEEPVLWDLTTTGDLEIEDGDSLGGSFDTAATGIAQAAVIGGDGYGPSPIVVALTKTGELEGGAYLPGVGGAFLEPLADNVASFSLSAAPGANGHPVLAWISTSGVVEVSAGGLAQPPIEEATGATAVALAPNSGPSDPLIGYVSSNGTFFDREGRRALDPASPWVEVARGVSSIALAGGDLPSADAIEAYTRAGTFFARRGTRGLFTEEATGVSQIAVAAVGPQARPILAYVAANVAGEEALRSTPGRAGLTVNGGNLEVEEGSVRSKSFTEQATGVTAVSVAAGMTDAGFPVVGAIADGTFKTEDGLLNGAWTTEGTGVVAAGVASLTVS
jgi:hypothetical protein